MSEQIEPLSAEDMVAAAMLAYQTGDWQAWLDWLHERGVRQLGGPPTKMVPAWKENGTVMTGGAGYSTTATYHAWLPETNVYRTAPVNENAASEGK